MAQLKDSVVLGSLRVTDTIFGTTGQFTKLNVPIDSNNTAYGPGSAGNVLMSNGTSVYWGTDSKGVVSVQVQASSPLQSSTNTAQNSSLNTTISFINQGPNKILAGPSSGTANAAPTFRALVAADLPTSGVTAGSFGPSAAVTGSNNATMNVPYITVDAYGRITAISNKTYTAVNTWRSISDAIDSTSSDVSASSKAVKTAYDLAASKTSLTIGTTATTAAAGNHTHSYLANTNTGAADRPIYITGNAASQTTYRMAGTNVTATTALAITTNLDTGIWYVSGTNSTDLYSQSDGVAYVEKYSDSWIHEIYGDYRTGQIAVRGKNNGTWQAWRKILDSSNWKTLIGATTASGSATKYLREDGTWETPSYTTSLALTAITGTDDLRAIEALTGTSGFLKKTAANTWSLDTNTYLTSASTLDATKLSGTIPSGCYTNSRDPGYGQITPANNASTVTALTGNTTPAVATNYSEGIKFTGANKWIVLAGSNSSTAGSDEIKFAHHVPSSISNTGPTSAQTPGYNATFNIPVISVDEAGHVTGISTTTVKIPATDNTNNAATHTLATTTKYYVTGTTSAATSTAGDSFDTGVYVTANAGELSALKYSVHDTSSTPVEKVQFVWNSTDSTLDFVFA